MRRQTRKPRAVQGTTRATQPKMTFLRYADLVAHGIVKNRTTLRRWMDSVGFPKPVRLGLNSVAWRLTDVEQWLARRARSAA